MRGSRISAALLVAAAACSGQRPAPKLDARVEAAIPDAAVAVTGFDAAPAVAARQLLEVRLPAAPPAGAATAKVVIELHENRMAPTEYEGVRLLVGAAAPRELKVGERVELTIATSTDQPYRFEAGQLPVLAAVRPGDTLLIGEGHDGGWHAEIANRQLHNASKAITTCGKRGGECAKLLLSESVQEGDPVCPKRDDESYKCVQAPLARARGPVAMNSRATVSEASESGLFDDLDTVPLAPKGLVAGAVGAWIPVAIGGERMPRVSIGEASALVLMGPGERWEVWLAPGGRVDAALITK